LIRSLTILFLILLANLALGQVDSTQHVRHSSPSPDTTKHNKPIAKDSLKFGSGKNDSLSIKALHKTDSVNGQLKKFQSFRLQVPKNNTADSVKNALTKDLSKPAIIASKVSKKVSKKVSNLSPQKQVALYNKRLKKMQKRLQHRIDSIAKLKVKDPGVAKAEAALKHNLDSIKNAGPIKDIKDAEQKLAKLESSMNGKVKGLEGKVNQQLGDLKKMGVNTPNLNVPNANIPNVSVPNLNVPGINANLPNINTGSTLNTNLSNVTTPSLGNTSLPSGGVSLPNTSGLTNNLLPNGELQSLEKDASQLTKATGDISKAEGEMKNLNPDKLETTLEKDAQNINGVKQFGGQTMQAEQYKKMVQKWESDPEYRKEMAVTQAKEQAINHFAGEEKQLMAAMQQLSNVKAKYKDAEGVLDMFKKPTNPMKGRPFIERVRPGINLQFQSKQGFLVDFNPQAGYRLSGRVTLGIGWNERWGYDFSKRNYVSQDHIYGPRAYAQVKIKTGIYGMLTPEVMNALVSPSFSSTDPGTRQWVWSWMAGMRKEFRYSKNILGSLQVLYNLYDPYHQSPYVNKLNIRMGFEFPLRKKFPNHD
jgi:hypothetical protein